MRFDKRRNLSHANVPLRITISGWMLLLIQRFGFFLSSGRDFPTEFRVSVVRDPRGGGEPDSGGSGQECDGIEACGNVDLM